MQFVTTETKALVDSGCACTIFHKILANVVLNGDKCNCVKMLSNDQDLHEIAPLNFSVQFVTIEKKHWCIQAVPVLYFTKLLPMQYKMEMNAATG